jgi:hypothetical protein
MTMVPAIRNLPTSAAALEEDPDDAEKEDGDADREADQPQEGLAHGDRLARLLIDDA